MNRQAGQWWEMGEELDDDFWMAMHLEANPRRAAPPAALPADVVEALLAPASAADAPEGDSPECSICLEAIFDAAEAAGGGEAGGEAAAAPASPAKRGDGVKVRCGHLFHRRCITEWLKHDLRCPNCRYDLLHQKAG